MDSNHPTNDFQDLIPITPVEEKELKRVYDMLCDYLKKKGLEKELDELEQANEKINQRLVMDNEEYPGSSAKLSSQLVSSNYGEINKNERRIDEIKAEIASLNNNPNKKISVQDVMEILKRLGQKITKPEVEEMLWECDEDLDNCLNWNEFKLMFCRNNTDRTGLEPSRMFNLTQYLIYDKNRNGCVSIDETMNMLYARHGRVKMETKLKELFGDLMPVNGVSGGGEIEFPRYLAAVEKIQSDAFFNTTKGRNVASKTGSAEVIKAALSKSQTLQLTNRPMLNSRRMNSSSMRINGVTKLPAITGGNY